MTVYFMDSMRGYTTLSSATSGLTSTYTVQSAQSNLDFVTGRYADRYLRLTSNDQRVISRSLPSVVDELYVGMDFQAGQLPSSDVSLCRFNRGGTGSQQVTFTITSAGAIRAYRGTTAGTVLGTSASGMVNAGFLAHFEFHVKVHSTDGEVTVWRNGTQILAITNANTQEQASTGIDQIGWVLSNAVYNSGVDSKFGANFISTTRLNVSRIITLSPQADDSVTWTPTSGSDNFAMLDSTTIDSATEVATATLNNVDRYVMTDMPLAPQTIHAVQWRGVGRRSDVNTRLQPYFFDGTNEMLGSNLDPGSVGHRPIQQVFHTQPDTTAWTTAALNSMRMGVKKPVSSGTAGLCHLMCEVLASLALEPGAPLVPGAPTGRRILQVIS